jgi:protein TonB
MTSAPIELAAGPDAVDEELAALARARREDRRRWRWALGVAAVLHLALAALPAPELSRAEPPAAPPKEVFVVHDVALPTAPESAPREPGGESDRRLPIAEPTPDLPEPIRIVGVIEQELEVPLDDSLLGVPAAPPGPAAVPEAPIQVGGDVRPPERLQAPPPVYTDLARKARLEGVVIVQAIIDRDGDVTSMKVLRGLPMGLEDEAVRAIKRWKFRPATLNGRPVTVYYNLTVNFKLQ